MITVSDDGVMAVQPKSKHALYRGERNGAVYIVDETNTSAMVLLSPNDGSSPVMGSAYSVTEVMTGTHFTRLPKGTQFIITQD